MNQIIYISNIFQSLNCPRTVALINDISNDVQLDRTSEILRKLPQLVLLFHAEYFFMVPELGRIFTFIGTTIFSAAVKDKKVFFKKINELNYLIFKFHKNITLIDDLFRKITTMKKRNGLKSKIFRRNTLNNVNMERTEFLMHVLEYGWTVEGLFDEGLRFLYVFIAMAKGIDIDYFDIQEWNIFKLREELKILTKERSEVLFSGYENGHLRNSIFHFRLSYDETTKMMRFQDYHRGRKTYDRKFSLPHFKRMFLFVGQVDFLIMVTLHILQIIKLSFDEKMWTE